MSKYFIRHPGREHYLWGDDPVLLKEQYYEGFNPVQEKIGYEELKSLKEELEAVKRENLDLKDSLNKRDQNWIDLGRQNEIRLSAELEASNRERDEAIRKGESLCQQNGSLLVEAHDLKRERDQWKSKHAKLREAAKSLIENYEATFAIKGGLYERPLEKISEYDIFSSIKEALAEDEKQ